MLNCSLILDVSNECNEANCPSGENKMCKEVGGVNVCECADGFSEDENNVCVKGIIFIIFYIFRNVMVIDILIIHHIFVNNFKKRNEIVKFQLTLKK